MKKLMIIVAMLVLVGCENMPVAVPAKESSIENVINFPGYSKAQIYAATKSWIVESFHSAKAVIQDDDKEVGRIIGHTNVPYVCPYNSFICGGLRDDRFNFTMRVDIKDEKIKITLNQMYVGAGHLWQADFDANARPALDRISESLRATIEKEKSSTSW